MEKVATVGARGKHARMLPLLGLIAALAQPALAGARSRADEPKTLVVMVEERTLLDWPALEALAREFEAEHAGVRVQLLDEAGASGARDKIKFMLAGDLQLDVARIDVTELSAYLTEGALVDLDAEFSGDASWSAAAYFKAPLDALRDERGHLYGLPSTFTPYVMYFNRDLLDRAHVAAPRAGWTWEDLRRAARATTLDTDGDGKTDQYGISLTQWLQAVVPWVWQNGGDLLDARGERSRMGESEFAGAIEFLHALLHADKVASFDASFESQLTQGLFQSGRAAFYGPVGYWETYRFRNITQFRWDVAPLPRGKSAATSIAMTAYVVPRTTRDPALACAFVKKLGKPFFQRTLAEIGNGVPGLESAARSESFLKPDVAPESERVFLDVLPAARFMPTLANWKKIESICQSELESCLLVADYDVRAACGRMAARTDEYLARERQRRSRPPLWRGTLELAAGLSVLALIAAFALRRGPRGPALIARQEKHGYAMLAPWAAGFLLFLFGPAVVSLVLALCEWSPLSPIEDVRWVGLDNFARLAQDGTFRTSLRVTLLYATFSVPLGLALALALALFLRAESRLARIVRTLCYIPAVLSPVIVAALWRWILDPEQGLANAALARIGIDGPAWLRDPAWVLPSFVVMSLWSVGAQMLVFIAALKALDPSLEEAARIDGAGAGRRLVHITLPGLTPVILFNLVTGTVEAFQIFAQPYVMTGGGPGDASRFLVLYLYESGFRHLDMGYASAIAWVLFLLLATVCAVAIGSSKRWVHYAGRSGR